MRINNNLMAMNAHRYMSQASSKQSKSLEKLSSGLAINSAADNAAGLAISEKMRSQINGLEQASKNAQDGISMIQTAEGALDETTSILQRMNELATQAANGTLSSDDLTAVDAEMDALVTEIDRISDATKFNGTVLLDGTLNISLQIGSENSAEQQISVALATAIDSTLTDGTTALSAIDVTAAGGAVAAMDSIQDALTTVSSTRADFGAVQNRLEHTINNLSTTSENLTASESRIRDVDMAKEMMDYTKLGILQQASQAMLAQANQAPQGVLQLLR